MKLPRDIDAEFGLREYFIQLLNGSEISEVGGNVSRERIGGNERVVREVLREDLRERKAGDQYGEGQR